MNLKKRIRPLHHLLPAIGLFLTLACYGQKITVTESGDAVVTTVYEADPSDIVSDWKNLMKKYGAKVDAGKDKIVAKGALIKTMSAGTWDVTATVEKVKTGEVKLTVIFDPIATAGATTPDRKVYMETGKGIVRDFAAKSSSEALSNLIKDNQKTLDKLNKQQDGIVKDNAGLAGDNENYKKKITDNERQITMNKDKIEAKKKEIDAQQKVVDGIKERQKALN